MTTVCGSGGSTLADTDDAVGQAVARAVEALGEATASLGLLFASPAHELGDALGAARRVAPDADWLGCGTAGELTEGGRTDGGVAVFLSAWGDAGEHRLSPVRPLGEDVETVARELVDGHAALVGRAPVRGWEHSVTLLLADGLSPRFEKLVTAMRRATSLHHVVVGGGAADGGALERTFAGSHDTVIEGGAVAVHVASRRRWGIGIGQGAKAFTDRMTVTRADRNVVLEIDGRPAIDVYRDYATGRGETFDPDRAGSYLVENELGIYFFDDIVRVRAGLGTTDGGGIAYAGEVPEGATVAIVRATPDELVDAAREAAAQARADLGGPAAGALMFSCVTRGMVLGVRGGEEIEAVADVFGRDVPIAGFSSYGEVARVPGKLDGYHNHTLVVAAIPQ